MATNVDDLANVLRESRHFPSRKKMEISKIRADHRDMAVVVFEGKEDKLVYRPWFKRCAETVRYEPVVAEGKKAVLAVRAMIKRDVTGQFDGVFFIIDRDYDDYQGDDPGEEIFCTDRYAIENYLVDADVVDSIMCDNFHCSGAGHRRAEVIDAFRSALNEFCELVRPVNERVFFARRLGLKLTGGIPELARYLVIDVDGCHQKTEFPDGFVGLEREPNYDETSDLSREFSQMNPALRHRGKFLMEFFRKWMRAVAEDGASEVPRLFGSKLKGVVDPNQIGLGSMAIVSPMPDGFAEFAQRISG